MALARVRAFLKLSRDTRTIRTQARYDFARNENPDMTRGMGPRSAPFPALATPRQVQTCPSLHPLELCLISVLASPVSG
jgi:hypothetical protein